MYNKLSDAIHTANRKSLLNKTTLLTSSAAILLMGMTAQVHAQEAAVEGEEVVITGIRGALKNAVDIKRNATAIVDAVSAEDVGKFPDSDIGESLGRIPGVTVGRAFGQGSSVSIRGSAPQMTLTQLNGQSVASTGWYDQVSIDRSFNYSMLPSELIGGMEVYKSAQADIAEGGIGGTVNVKTRKPLDLDANTAFAGIKAAKGTLSDDLAPEVSGLYSWKNDAETFGVLVAGATSSGDYVRRGDEADLRWSNDVAPSTFVQEREHTALDVTLQAKPTDNLEFGAHLLSLSLTGDNTNTSLYLFNAGGTCTKKNAAGTCVMSTVSNSAPSDTFMQTWGRIGEMTSDTIDLNAAYTGDTFKATAAIGKTKAEGGTALTTNFGYYAGNMPKWAGTIDATGKQIKVIPSQALVVNMSNLPANSSPEGWAIGKGPNSDEETYVQVDFDFELDLGAIKSFKTGLRSTDHNVVKENYKGTLKAGYAAQPTSNFYGGKLEVGNNGFITPKPKLGAMINATVAGIDRWTEMRSGFASLNEKNNALYGMFTFEAEGVKGNFGLRYIETDAKGGSYKVDGTPLAAGDQEGNTYYSKTKSYDDASYHDVLPSVNVSFDLNDDLVLRVSASQAINRANYDNMFTSATQAGYQDTVVGNESVTTGDIGLLPMKSSQADVGIEYYYGDGNLVSLTYFTKDINNFITSNTLVNQSIGLVSPDSGKDSWTVNKYVNAGGGNIEGLEFQVNHAFANGFGVSVNYTYADGEAPGASYQDNIGVFTESSKDSANLVGYWENDTYSARAAYNWRSKYLVRETGYYGNRMYDAFGSLDLSFGWHVTENIGLTFEASNVLEEDDIQYGAADKSTTLKDSLKAGYPAWSYLGEARYTLGANFKF
jgi:iron complex outermembrane receptor protein